jgi:hypothetical protein
MILPISASQVARIIRMSHRHPALTTGLMGQLSINNAGSNLGFLGKSRNRIPGSKGPALFGNGQGPHLLNHVNPKRHVETPEGVWTRVTRIVPSLVTSLWDMWKELGVFNLETRLLMVNRICLLGCVTSVTPNAWADVVKMETTMTSLG